MNVSQRESRSTTALCSLLGYTRQAYYQHKKQLEKESLQHDWLIDQVLNIKKKQKRIGCRKLLFLLKPFMEEHNISIGRDCFFDLLSERCLLVRKRKRNKPITTFSDHWMRKYPNLIKGIYPTAPGQLWVIDITYIVVNDGFAYLSLVTDAYSRKIVGFYLSVDLSAEGCIRALEMALRNNKGDLGRLIHHSDRGSQYCCSDYVGILNDNFIKISMT